MSVVCCQVESGRGLCGELITRPEESYRLWCVIVCNVEENLKNEEAMSRVGSQRHKKISWTNKRFDTIKMHGAAIKKLLGFNI
jgi:hypothetical protein